jgi:DNA-binding NarL/FixJ family response regulator
MAEFGKSLVHGKAVLIADDDEYFRLALRSLLEDRLGVSVVYEAASFDAAIEILASTNDLALVLFDLNMPGMNNWEDLRSVRDTFPAVRVAVVSASRNRSDILRALEAGMHGYVVKGLGVAALELALREICQGAVYIPPFFPDMRPGPDEMGKTIDLPAPVPAVFAKASLLPLNRGSRRLTPRQREILGLLVAGRSNKAMARSLNLSEGTVKFHMSAVFRVLGASNRVEAATAGARLLAQIEDLDPAA